MLNYDNYNHISVFNHLKTGKNIIFINIFYTATYRYYYLKAIFIICRQKITKNLIY